jgi:hypothetical protein
MQREGCLHSHCLARDGRTDEVWYGLLREEEAAQDRCRGRVRVASSRCGSRV